MRAQVQQLQPGTRVLAPPGVINQVNPGVNNQAILQSAQMRMPPIPIPGPPPKPGSTSTGLFVVFRLEYERSYLINFILSTL